MFIALFISIIVLCGTYNVLMYIPPLILNVRNIPLITVNTTNIVMNLNNVMLFGIWWYARDKSTNIIKTLLSPNRKMVAPYSSDLEW